MRKIRALDWYMLKTFYRFARENKRAGRFFSFVARASAIVFFGVYAFVSAALILGDSPALVLHFAVPGAALLSSLLLRAVIRRPRPYLSHARISSPLAEKKSWSFPSNHAVCACAIAFSCFYFNFMFGAAVFFLAVLTAMSRVFVGAHYPSDVAAGFVWGGFVSVVGFSIVPYLLL